MKLHFVLFLIFTYLNTTLAQNLFPNPSFEDKRANRQSMHPWQMINTIDYFIYDASKEGQILKTKIKDKNFKLRTARTGNAYVGLRVWPKYSEYLVIQLEEPLEKEAKYLFEMYVVLSPHSNSLLKSIGLSAYSFKAPYAQQSANSDYPSQFNIYNEKGIGNDKNWTKVAGVFIANGGERFITIGNFSLNNKNKFKTRKLTFKKREAYYYIDDLALYKLDKFGYPIYGDTTSTIASKQTIETELVLTNEVPDEYYRTILFPPQSSDLNYEAYLKLAHIIDYLNKNPEIQVKIVGYTAKNEILDSLPDTEMKKTNISLAIRRAKSTYHFLTGNRINRNRVLIYYSTELCKAETNTDNDYDCKKVEIEFFKGIHKHSSKNLIQIAP